MPSHYQPSRGGHAPGDLREALQAWIDEGAPPTIEVGGTERSDDWLLGQLWNCTDVLPARCCTELDLAPGSTYAQGVRSIHTLLSV